MKNNILPVECIKWLKECFIEFGKKGPKLEIVFTLKLKEEILVVAIFNNIPEVIEDLVSAEFMERLKNSFLNKYKERKIDWHFNLRFFDKRNFLFGVSRFDPDILIFFTNTVQIIIGKENYTAVKNSFVKDNYLPEPGLVFLPFWEDTLITWSIAYERLVALDIQLTRCFLNGIKLFYAITIDKNELNLKNIVKLTDMETLSSIYNSMEFIKEKKKKGFSKEKLAKCIFQEAPDNIQQKIVLVEEFIVQLIEYVLKWLEEKSKNYPLNTLLNWLIIFNNYYQHMQGGIKFKDFAFAFLKSLTPPVSKDSEDYNNIQLTAKKIGLNGFK